MGQNPTRQNVRSSCGRSLYWLGNSLGKESGITKVLACLIRKISCRIAAYALESAV